MIRPLDQPKPAGSRSSARPTESGSVDLVALERRLADGYARIEVARLSGEDVAAWEEFWIDLLHTYEALIDELPQAA